MTSKSARARPRERRISLAVGLALLGCSEDPSAPLPPGAPERPRIGIALGERIDGLDAALRESLRARELEVSFEQAYGRPAAQLEQIGRLLETGVSALVLGPIVPDVLYGATTAAAERKIPAIAMLRGDGRSGSWVGVGSATLAREAGERAGAWLVAQGRARPGVVRVVVVEDSRWPETRRRVEQTLRGLEAVCGEIDLPLRVQAEGAPADVARTVIEGLTRLRGADVLLAGDRATTAAAALAAGQMPVPVPVNKELLVVGTTDDDGLVEAARAAGSRLLFVAWKRDDLVRELAAAVADALASPATPVRREVPCELVGIGAPQR